MTKNEVEKQKIDLTNMINEEFNLNLSPEEVDKIAEKSKNIKYNDLKIKHFMRNALKFNSIRGN